MKKPYQRMKGSAGRNPLRNDRGDISIFTCFFVVGIVTLVALLMLYASILITCINIRNGAKMELNNLSASIYADTCRSQRETNFSEYLNTLYSSGDYTAMLKDMVTDGLASRRGIQSNGDIISSLGIGIVWFEETEEPGGEIEAPDVEYRVDTDVSTAIRLRTGGRLIPDNPATVTFHIMGRSYTVRNIVIPANDSQLVWVKWHTPDTPQTITITVSLSRGFTAQDTFVAKIVDLNEKIPPDPLATDVNPGYSVPALPSNPQKLRANWACGAVTGSRTGNGSGHFYNTNLGCFQSAAGRTSPYLNELAGCQVCRCCL